MQVGAEESREPRIKLRPGAILLPPHAESRWRKTQRLGEARNALPASPNLGFDFFRVAKRASLAFHWNTEP